MALHGIILPCLDWISSCYFDMFDNMQKGICRAVGPSLVISLESLAHRRNVAKLSRFYWYYFGRCLSELPELISFPYSRGKSTF